MYLLLRNVIHINNCKINQFIYMYIYVLYYQIIELKTLYMMDDVKYNNTTQDAL
ncbi:hypothetical protein ChPV134 [Cheloniid poxvirus 1]|nr:hypothetical protein ChPV134 [Cheloniid poxvirus 1]